MPPLAVLAVGVTAVSFSAILISISQAPALVLAFYRLAITTALFLPAVLWLHGGEALRLGDDLGATLASGFFLACHFAAWISSLDYTTVASSVILVTLHPVLVLAADAWVFGDKPTRGRIIGAVIAIGGSAVITTGDFRLNGEAFSGDVLALLGAVFMALYLLIGRRVRQTHAVLPYTTVTYGTASIILLVFIAAFDLRLYPYPPREIWIFIGLALLPTIFGHTLFNWALEHVPTSVVSISTLGEPVGSTVLAALLLHEMPTSVQVIGGSIILFGLWLSLRPQSGTGEADGPQDTEGGSAASGGT